MFPVGSCTCGGTLFLYLGSEGDNVKNIYCTDCHSVLDVFHPKDGPIFFVGPTKQAELLESTYGMEAVRKFRDP